MSSSDRHHQWIDDDDEGVVDDDEDEDDGGGGDDDNNSENNDVGDNYTDEYEREGKDIGSGNRSNVTTTMTMPAAIIANNHERGGETRTGITTDSKISSLTTRVTNGSSFDIGYSPEAKLIIARLERLVEAK